MKQTFLYVIQILHNFVQGEDKIQFLSLVLKLISKFDLINISLIDKRTRFIFKLDNKYIFTGFNINQILLVSHFLLLAVAQNRDKIFYQLDRKMSAPAPGFIYKGRYKVTLRITELNNEYVISKILGIKINYSKNLFFETVRNFKYLRTAFEQDLLIFNEGKLLNIREIIITHNV